MDKIGRDNVECKARFLLLNGERRSGSEDRKNPQVYRVTEFKEQRR